MGDANLITELFKLRELSLATGRRGSQSYSKHKNDALLLPLKVEGIHARTGECFRS